MKVRLLFQLILCMLSASARAQSTLDAYVQQALRDNLVLKQRTVSLEQSMLALKEARALYLPTTSLEGQHILSQGGRRINLPIGDLLNPVYATLNQLTSSNRFPAISNVAEQLNPNNFYDLRIKTVMPILNQDLRYNKAVKAQQVILKQQEADLYARELVREVKVSYYNILMARKAIEIYTSALAVVKENLRVNRSLLANGKSLPAWVSRAEAEVFQVESELTSAKEQVSRAEAWFNALLNRELNTPVEASDIPLENLIPASEQQNASKREELAQLNTLRSIQSETLKFNKSFQRPKLNAFLDLAAQDFNFRVRDQSFFYLGGLQFSVPIYAGNRNRLKIQQTQLDLKQTELSIQDSKNKLEVAVLQARIQMKTSYERYLSALKQEEAARQYFKLIDRGYREGVNSLIEWLDARNQQTQSALRKELDFFTHLQSLADLERQTAAFPLPKQ